MTKGISSGFLVACGFTIRLCGEYIWEHNIENAISSGFVAVLFAVVGILLMFSEELNLDL